MRKQILVFIDWFLPGYKAGGPIKSVANIVEALHKDCDFHIITSDTDLHETHPYSDIIADTWITQYHANIMYVSKSMQTRAHFKKLISELQFDVVYFNSLFSKNFTLFPLQVIKKLRPNAKIVLAPRGMLGEGSLKVKSFKKKVFLQGVKWIGLFDNICWHVSSAQESQDVKASFGEAAKTAIAMNIAFPMQKLEMKPKEANALKIVFISRVLPIKNLLSAILYIQQVSPKFNITFTVIGPIEDDYYWENCKQEAEKLPTNILFCYKGPIPNSELPKILAKQHVLLLPTLHENYGHVIVESIANGCPVLISRHTPWHDLETHGVGADIALEHPEKFVAEIEKFAAMNQEQFFEYSQNCAKFMAEKICDNHIIEENKKLFLS